MPTGARGYSDAPRITVNELLKDPLVIPALILDITQNEFIMDSVLRMGGAAPSGAVRYSESTPLYADDFPEIRPEFGEVPVVPTSIGVPRVVFSHERAMAIMVSDEMRRRQSIDPDPRRSGLSSARSPSSRRPSTCPAWCSATSAPWPSWCRMRCGAGSPSTR